MVIICERTGRWAAALRRAAAGKFDVPIVETRSLADCWAELERHPESVVAIELTLQNAEAVTQRLVQLQKQYPRAAAIVLGRYGTESLQWMMREAGATHILFSPRSCGIVLRMAQRHLKEVTRPAQDWRQRIWERLPWPSAEPLK